MRLLQKLEDFRLLPFFVLLSMVLGISLGKISHISDYQLTPPIEAIKSILAGTYEFSLPNTLVLGVVIGLFMMMYPAMTNVRLDELGQAFRSPKQLLIVAFFNYAVAPFFMYALAKIFLASHTELATGLVLYGIAPCIAMVIIFTFLAKGNTPLALVLVAFNSIVQMILIPLYAKVLIGEVHFDVRVVGESVILYLGLPLLLGFLTRQVGIKRVGEEGFEQFKVFLNALSILGLLFTLVVMFALKGDLILERPLIVVEMAIPMTIFFFVIFNVVYLTGWRLGLNYRDAVAVAFNSTGRDFEIAIAIAITAFSPTVALATVVGPLIEVPIMLSLDWLAMRTSPRLFGTVPREVEKVAVGRFGLAAEAADPPEE
ncbi:MAG: bile acid:sodium symporter [Chloroflexi bacterium]|nr:bile acid:sodium symporter [Chloroflexota bacterium]MCL5076065.1 bile acid:sodium symporter [Chloroflexota bacterium]